jgi:hypothetical protein
VTSLVPVAVAAAAVLIAVSWALRSARRAADALSTDEEEPPFALPALPGLEQPGSVAPSTSDAPNRRAPLVPIAGAEGPGTASEVGDVLISLIGVPEELAQGDVDPRPSGSRLPLLRGDSASPFRDESVDLSAPEAEVGADQDAASRVLEPGSHRRPAGPGPIVAGTAGAMAFGGALVLGAPAIVALLIGVAGGSLVLAAVRQIEVSRARATQPRFEAELARGLDKLDGLLAQGTPPERGLILLAKATDEGPLWQELREATASWWPEAGRPEAFVAARARRGAEWGRVLFALDEAARTGADPRRLLAHTAESLRSGGGRPEPPDGLDPGAAIAIAGSIAATAAAIAIAIMGT